MSEFAVGVAIGLVAGGFIAWLVASQFGRNRFLQESTELKSRLSVEEATANQLRIRLDAEQTETTELRTRLASAELARVTAQTKLEASLSNIEEHKKFFVGVETALQSTFESLALKVQRENSSEFIKQAALQMNPLKEALERYEKQLKTMDTNSATSFAGVRQLVETHVVALEKETAKLSTALRAPQVRGRWGEITLQRVVEIAGMSPHCDFDLQPSVEGESGVKRPDLVVRLPQGRRIVVDAKAPITAYLDAVDAIDEGSRRDCLVRHAGAVRNHMTLLSAKEYWKQFEPTPDFVVMFIPGESFFSAALEQDRNLMEEAFQKKIILATPSTLLALLRTVAHSWQQRDVAENAQRIAVSGRELYERIKVFATHVGNIAKGLRNANDAYNESVSSWQTRVLPSGRRMMELGAVRQDTPLPELHPIDSTPVSVDTPGLQPTIDAPRSDN